MFILCPSIWKTKTGAEPVYLNVYDLTAANVYAYWFGLGVYHSGVQVHGVEYAYGAHEYPTSGIFDSDPRSCPGFSFRKSILVGRTDLGPEDVCDLMEQLSKNYTGNNYNLISKNCNHFCNDVCIRLTGNSIPRWINRLANFGTVSHSPEFFLLFDFIRFLIANLAFFLNRLGFFCKCVLPQHVAAIKSRAEEGEKHRLSTDQKVVLRRRSGSRKKLLESSAETGRVSS